MMASAIAYVRDTAIAFGEAWNEFWLRPSSPRPLAAVRIGLAVLLLYWFASFAPDLNALFGSGGILPAYGVNQWEQTLFAEQYPFSDANRRVLPDSTGMSLLGFVDAPEELWAVWGVAIVASLLLAAGCFSRTSAVISLVVFLSFVNRAPMLAGPFEAVAAMLLFYLALSPCGAVCSIDRWLKLRKAPRTSDDIEHTSLCQAPPRWSATVTLRLMQVHLCAIYVFMALAQWGGGGGETPWATGEAIWLLAARPSAGLSFQWLANVPILIDFWTHGMWALVFTFPFLIWVRQGRPALLVMTAFMWFAFALLTGLYAFSLAMIVAGLTFCPVLAGRRIGAQT